MQRGPLAAVGAVIAAYTLAFVPFLWGAWVYSRRSDNYGLLRSYWAHQGAYVLNLVTYVATWRALFRIALGRDTWARTARVGRGRRATSVPRGTPPLGGTTNPSGTEEQPGRAVNRPAGAQDVGARAGTGAVGPASGRRPHRHDR